MYMDGVGIRPAMLEVGERLATYGYLVLLPDLCYPSGPYEPMNAAQVFADPAKHGWMLRERRSTTSPPPSATTGPWWRCSRRSWCSAKEGGSAHGTGPARPASTK